MRSDARNANRLSFHLLELGVRIYVGLFLVLYLTDAVFPALDYVPLVRSPVGLFVILAVPVLVRVHWPDYRQNALTGSLALWRDNRQVIIAFLGLITLSFLTALEPGANVADRGAKAVYILLYRFALFFVALSSAVMLLRLGWRWLVVVALLVLLGSILFDVAYPGTFSTADGRAGGFQENPNVAAIAVMMLLAVSVHYDRVHMFDLVLIVAAAVGVFATLSRGGMLQLSLFLANYLYFTGRGRRIRQLVLAPCVAAAMVAAALVIAGHITAASDMFATENAQRRLATFTGESETVYETDTARLSLVPQYLALIDRHMLLGYGTGFSRSLPLGPHNSYLDFWVNNGFAGLILYLWLLLALLSLCWARRFWPGFVFTQIALLAGMFTHDVIHLGVFLMLGGLVLGISWGTTARATAAGLADRIAEGGAAVRRHPATVA